MKPCAITRVSLNGVAVDVSIDVDPIRPLLLVMDATGAIVGVDQGDGVRKLPRPLSTYR